MFNKKIGIRFTLLVLLTNLHVSGQFLFQGETSSDYTGKTIYLSLVENYRKVSRVYTHQIVQASKIDEEGRFFFVGNHLPINNRIYRIHFDTCDNQSQTKHLMKACTDTQSVLFLANNRDSINFPRPTDNQGFCEIHSSNSASTFILDFEQKKEDWIFEMQKNETEISQKLGLKNFTQRILTYALEKEEPLLDLYAYNFLSNRENETYSFYLETLRSTSYYRELATKLEEKYPNASFTQIYLAEIKADEYMMEDLNKKTSNKVLYVFLGLMGLGMVFLLGLRSWKKRNQINPYDKLSGQERRVMKAILQGKSNKEIASQLFVSHSTVKTHVNNLYKKLNMSSRQELIQYFKGVK